MPDVDIERFHSFEHEGWQRASGYYARSLGGLTSQAIPAMLDTIVITKGSRVLDLCAGPGYGAAAAARRGAGSVGVDFSAEMVAAAKRLHPSLEFREADVEELPFADESFDAAIMNFGLLHLPRPERALAEAFRVLRPRGGFAFTVWSDPGPATGMGIVMGAVLAHGRIDVDLPPAPDSFRFSDPKESLNTLASVGFDSPVAREVPLLWRLAGADDLFEGVIEGSVRMAGLLRAQTPEAREAIKVELRNACKARQTPDGFEIPMPCMLVYATKP
jgi:ubiquinone/menaquinone biosynthesis C-methylase UbiE